ncbi:MAG TPA: DUF222 domain-containing protein, partial [Candidatus Eisenbacteria bacterium]|nr:DUF222 domain-containing protein [Candidatus Eisenbacteria bacterium]
MDTYELGRLSGREVLNVLYRIASQDQELTALYLAYIAEADARQLYRDEGCSSMHAFCVERLHLSDPAAFKRIHAARAARRFPEIFVAVADGRLHLSAVCMIAPHLTPENAASLIAEATHRRKFEIEQLLARRFPAPDRLAVDPEIRRLNPEPTQLAQSSQSASQPAQICSLPGPSQLPPEPVEDADRQADVKEPAPTFEDAALPLGAVEEATKKAGAPSLEGAPDSAPAPAPPPPPAPAQASFPALAALRSEQSERPITNPTPLAADRYEIRFTIDGATYEKLRFAQNLLGHAVPSGSIAELFRRGLGALVAETLKKRFGIGSKPKGARGRQARPSRRIISRRYIPAPIRRAVWERDGKQCTAVSRDGKRCEERKFLEFDHVVPVARGGKPTVKGLRMLCRAHNQLEAERAFGARFVKAKREKTRKQARLEVSNVPTAAVLPSSHPDSAATDTKREWIRQMAARLADLGIRRNDALRMVKRSGALN